MSKVDSLLQAYADFFVELEIPLKHIASVSVKEYADNYSIEVKPHWTSDGWIKANKAYRLSLPRFKENLTNRAVFQLVTFTAVIDSFMDVYEDEIPGCLALQKQLIDLEEAISKEWEKGGTTTQKSEQPAKKQGLLARIWKWLCSLFSN